MAFVIPVEMRNAKDAALFRAPLALYFARRASDGEWLYFQAESRTPVTTEVGQQPLIPMLPI